MYGTRFLDVSKDYNYQPTIVEFPVAVIFPSHELGTRHESASRERTILSQSRALVESVAFFLPDCSAVRG
jgi:hypothetical protein